MKPKILYENSRKVKCDFTQPRDIKLGEELLEVHESKKQNNVLEVGKVKWVRLM